ncbi:MAG: helix-turn-helix domain-containing protein [Atopobiaceae bacterium]|nr:helix-turn-helix domain-containing protein [Atopobiaceae bacterium]
MLTELGRYLRALREQSGELLKNMADRLSMSPAMLSSVENGSRNVPKEFVPKIVGEYGLDASEQEKLGLAIARTKEEVAVSLKGLSQSDQRLAFSFARRFSELGDEDKDSIKRILEKGGEDR